MSEDIPSTKGLKGAPKRAESARKMKAEKKLTAKKAAKKAAKKGSRKR